MEVSDVEGQAVVGFPNWQKWREGTGKRKCVRLCFFESH